MDVKTELTRLAKITDEHLEVYFDEEIARNFGFNQRQKKLVKKLLEHAKEHNLRSAKRLRASFVYYSYLLGRKRVDERIFRAAVAIELVHTALLMHDDFMDQDELRRGGPASHKFLAKGNKHYGEAMAVDLGDAVLSWGYEMLNGCQFKAELVNEAVNHLLRTIIKTGWGQAMDLNLEKEKKWTEDDVLTTHRAKTAIYTYENPLMVGAILGELSEEVKKILKEYGRWGGIAFQLQDDILGLFGNPEKTGKSADSDLLQGKRTLLMLVALKQGNKSDVKAIAKVWGKRRANKDDLRKAKEAVKRSGSLDYSIRISRQYAKKAVDVAEKLRKHKLNKKAIDYIQGIASYMVKRDV